MLSDDDGITDGVEAAVVVHGRTAGFDGAVVVDDDVAADAHAWIETVEYLPRRFVQIAIQSEYCQTADRRVRHGVAEEAREESHLTVQQAIAREVLLHLFVRLVVSVDDERRMVVIRERPVGQRFYDDRARSLSAARRTGIGRVADQHNGLIWTCDDRVDAVVARPTDAEPFGFKRARIERQNEPVRRAQSSPAPSKSRDVVLSAIRSRLASTRAIALGAFQPVPPRRRDVSSCPCRLTCATKPSLEPRSGRAAESPLAGTLVELVVPPAPDATFAVRQHRRDVVVTVSTAYRQRNSRNARPVLPRVHTDMMASCEAMAAGPAPSSMTPRSA